MASATGRVLGNYILGPLLGQGGMGAVYAAEHRFLGDWVAIKVLHPHLAAEPGAAERFLREATATRRVQHPNVVRVLDFGRAEDDGALYLVMERLSGETLAARLARSGRLDEPEVRRLGAQVADGLFAAHALGVVHRDLKPANLLVTESGTPIIVDFGIAKLLGEGTTAPGALFGTFEYSAPEQLGGGVVGPHSDIYALGVVLFQLATGELPHGGSKGGAPQLFSAPRRPSELVSISPALERLILQCLEAQPARRPSSMSEVRDRLHEEPRDGARATQPLSAGATLSAGAQIHLAPRTLAEPPSKVAPARRRFALVVLLAIFSCVGSALAWWQARGVLSPERPHPELPAVATAAPSPQPLPPAPAKPAPIVVAPVVVSPAARARAPVQVKVRSRPSGAQVIVDGQVRGLTPATLSLDLPRELLLIHDGCQPARVRVSHGGTIDVQLLLRGGPRSPVYHQSLD